MGGPADNINVGAAWVYTRSGGVWTQQGNKLVGTGAVGSAGQGSAVSISSDGNTAIVGGPGDNIVTGAVWVYTRSGGVWTQQGNKLLGTGAVGQARQGSAISISSDGNTAIVGGYADNGSSGAAWVFGQECTSPIVTGNNSICLGNSTTLTVRGADSYSWSPSIGLNVTTGAIIIANPTSTTNYIVTGTVGACTNTSTTMVTVNSLPTVTAFSSLTTVCSGNIVTLSGGGASTYAWTNSVIDGVPFYPTSNLTYTVIGTDKNLCLNKATKTITVNPIPTVSTIKQSSNTLTSSSASSNQWYKDGTIIPGATNPTYTITQTGNYSVMVTDVNSCSSTSASFSATYTVGGTGINSNDNQGAFSIYPNPNNGQFFVRLQNIAKCQLLVFNVLGERIYETTINTDKVEISLSEKPKGIYFYEVILDDSMISSGKMVVE